MNSNMPVLIPITAALSVFGLRPSDFGLLSAFDLRLSAFPRA
jgi:hypothetical protein